MRKFKANTMADFVHKQMAGAGGIGVKALRYPTRTT